MVTRAEIEVTHVGIPPMRPTSHLFQVFTQRKQDGDDPIPPIIQQIMAKVGFQILNKSPSIFAFNSIHITQYYANQLSFSFSFFPFLLLIPRINQSLLHLMRLLFQNLWLDKEK